MRAFIAIWLPRGITDNLSSLQPELPEGLRLVKMENMHLTLKFLGEISEKQARAISEALVSLSSPPFELQCRGLGAFPSLESARVLWAGIESPGLVLLHQELEPKLAGLGFEKEDRFVPHLTIARMRELLDAGPLISRHSGEIFGSCTVSSVSLMKSNLTHKGPIYEQLCSKKLTPPKEKV